MTDDNQETCTSKIKKWFLTFHKEPCFWLKTIRTTVIIILIFTALYIGITCVYEYFHEPKPLTDPERLGQFGDFLGGTLNPIFGFLTVCLLLWSIFIQRKELSLTREELKKSAIALNDQLKQIESDSARKQLTDILNNEYKIFDETLRLDFKFPNENGEIYCRKIYGCSNIKEIANTYISEQNLKTLNQKLENFHLLEEIKSIEDENFYAVVINLNRARDNILSIENVTKEMLNACNIESVESFWFMKFYDAMDDCRRAGIINKIEFDSRINDMQMYRKLYFTKNNKL